MILGHIKIKDFLDHVHGEVRGRLVTDGKDRFYATNYTYSEDDQGYLWISRVDSQGAAVKVPPIIELDESLVAFFGFYSGDGAKGSVVDNTQRVAPPISISQREPNLIRYSVSQFRRIFPGAIRFTFSLGEDSAYFMAGDGHEQLKAFYDGDVPATPLLELVRPKLDPGDIRYLAEGGLSRSHGTNKDFLAFYYHHKAAMEAILSEQKRTQIERTGLTLGSADRVGASLRRPFKKGARQPGGSSRADETHVGGVTGLGELLLKMVHETESSIVDDLQVSTQGLVHWTDKPSSIGEHLDVATFFELHPYGEIAGERPSIQLGGGRAPLAIGTLVGCWPRSKTTTVYATLRLDPLWCYTSGLYLAEGRTDKAMLFSMYRERPSGMGLGFTSSEDTSLRLILRALGYLFPKEECLDAWKVKVGSQYFPELVVIGLKNAVPMLRGGESGDGKLRTMEISLAIKEWALAVTPSMEPFSDKYSHVEPTGAGVPRIDFWASSALCKWYFSLIMYAAFGGVVPDPLTGFRR